MRHFLLIISGISLFAVTQITTFLVRQFFPDRIVVNDAAFFGLIESPFGVLTIVVLGFGLLWYTWRIQPTNPFAQWGALLILVGALSNVIDRFLYGGVIDYLAFLHFSTFNLADVLIVVGALLFVLTPNARVPRRDYTLSRP